MDNQTVFIISAAVINLAAIWKGFDNLFFYLMLWAATAGAYEMLFKV